jgi:hypothetical protein
MPRGFPARLEGGGVEDVEDLSGAGKSPAGAFDHPYPPHYRAALASSNAPLPATPQRPLRKRLPP